MKLKSRNFYQLSILMFIALLFSACSQKMTSLRHTDQVAFQQPETAVPEGSEKSSSVQTAKTVLAKTEVSVVALDKDNVEKTKEVSTAEKADEHGNKSI